MRSLTAAFILLLAFLPTSTTAQSPNPKAVRPPILTLTPAEFAPGDMVGGTFEFTGPGVPVITIPPCRKADGTLITVPPAWGLIFYRLDDNGRVLKTGSMLASDAVPYEVVPAGVRKSVVVPQVRVPDNYQASGRRLRVAAVVSYTHGEWKGAQCQTKSNTVEIASLPYEYRCGTKARPDDRCRYRRPF